MTRDTNSDDKRGSGRSDVVTSQALGDALALLGPEGQYWLKGGYAANSKGKSVPTMDKEALCFCVTGAVFRAIGSDAIGRDFKKAEGIISGQIDQSVGEWNDDPATTFGQVREVFNRAIAETFFSEEQEGRFAA